MGLDLVYGALSHDTRRRMVRQLSIAPSRVSELAIPFPVSLAAVSKHVAVLEAAGLIDRRVTGREHVLHLRADPLEAAAGWLEAYRPFWEERIDALERELRRR
jgi:DNA-binding transcriptional ArsR family regulator